MAIGSAIKAGKAFVEFVLSDKKLDSGLARIGGKLQKFGAIGAAATAPLIAGFTAAVLQFKNTGDALDKMRHRTGVAVEALSGLTFAAEQGGASSQILEKGFAGLSRSLFDAKRGSAEAVDALAALGLRFEDLDGLKPDQQFKRIADQMRLLKNESVQGAVAQKLFGRAGRQLLPTLKLGADGIQALQQQAHDMGITLTDEDAVAAAELQDALNLASNQVKGMAIQIGAAIAGPLTNFLSWASNILARIIGIIKANPRLVAGIVAVTVGIAAASAAAVVFGTILAIISAHPIIAALTLIAGLVLGVATYFGLASDAAGDFNSSLDSVDVPGASTSSAAAAQSAAVQSNLQGAINGQAVRPVAASAMATKPTPARDYGAEIAKATRETADGIAEMLRIARYNPLTAGSSLIAQFLP
jgi:TP901 family phage tail tape measure protein